MIRYNRANLRDGLWITWIHIFKEHGSKSIPTLILYTFIKKNWTTWLYTGPLVNQCSRKHIVTVNCNMGHTTAWLWLSARRRFKWRSSAWHVTLLKNSAQQTSHSMITIPLRTSQQPISFSKLLSMLTAHRNTSRSGSTTSLVYTD
jgi:hypothetical protein